MWRVRLALTRCISRFNPHRSRNINIFSGIRVEFKIRLILCDVIDPFSLKACPRRLIDFKSLIGAKEIL